MKLRRFSRKPLDEWTDSNLIRTFQRTGEHACFNVLFNRYYSFVYAQCLSVLADREEAKDQTIVIFTKLFERPPTSDIHSFDNWLFVFTRNHCISFLRKYKRTKEQQQKWIDHQIGVNDFMENETFRRLIHEEELQRDKLFKKAFEQLAIEQRECMTLFLWQLMSYKDIAEHQGIAIKQVKSYLQNGRRRLKVLVSRLKMEEQSND